MVFNILPINTTDYDDILLGWWNDWGWTPPNRDFLPDNGTGGIIVYDENLPVCAGFLYTTNSGVAWVDWIISSKEYRKKPHRKAALKLLIETLTNICKKSGHKYVYALIKNKSLIATYKEIGYVKGDSYTEEMIKKL
jgi:hypothetical protein